MSELLRLVSHTSFPLTTNRQGSKDWMTRLHELGANTYAERKGKSTVFIGNFRSRFRKREIECSVRSRVGNLDSHFRWN